MACNHGPCCINSGRLEGIAGYRFGLLGLPDGPAAMLVGMSSLRFVSQGCLRGQTEGIAKQDRAQLLQLFTTPGLRRTAKARASGEPKRCSLAKDIAEAARITSIVVPSFQYSQSIRNLKHASKWHCCLYIAHGNDP